MQTAVYAQLTSANDAEKASACMAKGDLECATMHQKNAAIASGHAQAYMATATGWLYSERRS